MISSAYAQPPTVLWFDGFGLNDIAISKDGQYVAAATIAQRVHFYSRSGDGTPLWTSTLSEDTLSIAISADGDCVAVGTSTGVHFWKNARSLTLNPTPDWRSKSIGQIDRRCLDISDDGNYVVACGSGEEVFYWANAKSNSGSDISTTWQRAFGAFIETIDLSSDGDYVAAGVWRDVAYWKNARSLTGNPAPTWFSTSPGDVIIDIAVSDDGNYVAAAGTAGPSPLYYWANARSLSGDPMYTWDSAPGVEFVALDMSSDGDSIFAGGYTATDDKVYFWTGSTTKMGTINPTWTYTITPIVDVSMDTVGDLMAAGDNGGNIHFFDRNGDKKWSQSLDTDMVSTSISGNGGTLAVATTGSSAWLLDTGYQSPIEPAPVGGLTITINKLEIMTPYIALAVAITTLATILVITIRRRTKH